MNSASLRTAASEQRLWSVAAGRAQAGDAECDAIAAVCERIAEQTSAEADRLRSALSRLGETTELQADTTGQLHLINAHAAEWRHAQRFVDIARQEGYVSWQDRTGGAAEAFFRTAGQLHLVRLADVPYTIVLSWPPSRAASLIPSPLRPTGRDLDAVSLPKATWPAYFAVRPLRLLRDRLAPSGSAALPLGPILSTPIDLLDPLLDFAGITGDDHLVDLGCGDGRVLIHAVHRHACRATGVENDPQLVERARTHVSRSGLNDRVTIVEGDARTFDLGDATVIFLFIPSEHVSSVAQDLREGGFGGRIISHEQVWIDGGHEPTESQVLTGTHSLTVAHRW